MGVVLKAFDAALARHVAIKILAAELATSSAARRRFAREAQAAAAVVHDHVVAIHLIDAAAGLPYLVMQHVAGRSLQERLSREGPLELAEVLRIGMQTALGLAAAHSQGLVHLDVKPANILLEYGVERVKLTDFGLARAVDDASQTQSGIVAGTPQYMAPEQAKGDLVDHRADLFSLGSVIYAMCTGHSPFRAGNTLAVLRRVCEDEPRRMRQIRPEIPAWLDALVARLLAKDPAQRFQSAAEVARRLEECLAHVQQPDVYALPAIDDARHSRRTKRIVLSGAAAVAGAAILAAVWGALGFPGFTADGTHRNGTVSDAQSTQGEPAYREASAGAIDMAVAWDNLAAPLAEIASTVERLRYELTGPRAAPAAPLDLMIADVTQALDSLQHEIERSSLTDSMRDRSFENVP
jgi:serine/threonine-protein kinase